MLGGRFKRAAALAAVGVFAVSAAAFAHEDSRPQVDPVAAEIVISHLKGKTRSCDGQDGAYVENRDVVATGISTGDARLSGAVTIKWEEIFNTSVDVSTGEAGPFVGRIVIRDAATGKKKMEGEFHNAGPLDMVQGVIVGEVEDDGTGPDEDSLGGGDLIAHWRITYGENGSISAQIGGGNAPDSRFPASISSGKCRGPFERIESDVPPPAEAAALNASGVGTRSLRR